MRVVIRWYREREFVGHVVCMQVQSRFKFRDISVVYIITSFLFICMCHLTLKYINFYLHIFLREWGISPLLLLSFLPHLCFSLLPLSFLLCLLKLPLTPVLWQWPPTLFISSSISLMTSTRSGRAALFVFFKEIWLQLTEGGEPTCETHFTAK